MTLTLLSPQKFVGCHADNRCWEFKKEHADVFYIAFMNMSPIVLKILGGGGGKT
jgi:hypothetical protein